MNHQHDWNWHACRKNLRIQYEQKWQNREQRRQTAIQTLRAALSSVCPHFPKVKTAYLFGTITRPGAFRLTSDIDVAIEVKGDRLDAEEYFALWRALEQAAPEWPIDLIELEQDLPFADSVRRSGELIYENRTPNTESRDSHGSGHHC